MAEALRLADRLESDFIRSQTMVDAAAELRRLHAENALLGNAADKLRMAWRDEVHCLMQDKRQLIAQRDALLKALKDMLLRDEKNTCRHEETHRGGAIWEICDSCGSMWADDEGGKLGLEDPKEWTQARAAIKAVEGKTK